MNEKQETRSALQHARALVRQGWCQDHVVRRHLDGSNEYCIVGALRTASYVCTYPGETYLQCVMLLWQHLCTAAGGLVSYLDLQAFNDHRGRTQAEVLDLFDQVLTEITK